ncbi:putative adenomatous polyposis coli protein [Sesbania bispinosa]|nr:putative adenomatous polyposis coli protein [Sesbania bispinosa]
MEERGRRPWRSSAKVMVAAAQQGAPGGRPFGRDWEVEDRTGRSGGGHGCTAMRHGGDERRRRGKWVAFPRRGERVRLVVMVLGVAAERLVVEIWEFLVRAQDCR